MSNFRLGDFEIARRQRKFTAAAGFLAVGAGLGALAVAFLTPKTGKHMRKEIRRRYEDARDAVEDWGDRANHMWDRRDRYADAARKTVNMARAFRRG